MGGWKGKLTQELDGYPHVLSPVLKAVGVLGRPKREDIVPDFRELTVQRRREYKSRKVI